MQSAWAEARQDTDGCSIWRKKRHVRRKPGGSNLPRTNMKIESSLPKGASKAASVSEKDKGIPHRPPTQSLAILRKPIFHSLTNDRRSYHAGYGSPCIALTVFGDLRLLAVLKRELKEARRT